MNCEECVRWLIVAVSVLTLKLNGLLGSLNCDVRVAVVRSLRLLV